MAHSRKLHPLSYLVSGLECEGLKPVRRLEWALPETVGGGKSHSPPKEEEPRKANICTTCCSYNNKNRMHTGAEGLTPQLGGDWREVGADWGEMKQVADIAMTRIKTVVPSLPLLVVGCGMCLLGWCNVCGWFSTDMMQ